MRVLLASSIIVIAVLLCIQVPQVETIDPESEIHSRIDGLRFRSAIPKRLSDLNIIRTISREESFRVLDKAYGPSEGWTPDYWYKVENLATGDKGWIASWYVAPTAVHSNTVVKTRLFYLAWDRAEQLAAFVVSRPVFSLVAGLASIFSVFAGWVGRLRAKSGLQKPTTRPCPVIPISPKPQPTKTTGAAAARFYGTTGGVAWSVPRRPTQA